jgi:predicted ATPase
VTSPNEARRTRRLKTGARGTAIESRSVNPATARLAPVPAQATPFVGRATEAAQIRELLASDHVRLLSITGPGGIGKSRLAFEVATQSAGRFADGVGYVSLSSVTDHQLVATAVAQALDVVESAERSVFENIVELLRHKEMLLLLDNFEHVLPAGQLLTQLLSACPRLKILVTSRAVLYVRGEHELTVAPLPVPEKPETVELAEHALGFDSVRLFAERATATNSDFRLTDDNAGAVAAICARLDGLPLALELAAAHTGVLGPDEMLARLRNTLEVLTGGSEELPERQQTMRATLDWDYDLLTEAEKLIWRRLSVPSGGFTVEAAQAIIDAPGYPPSYIVDAIESLVAKSLLSTQTRGEEGARFSMLKTLREYGLEKLDHTGEGTEVRDRHAAFFVALAEEGSPRLRGPEQAEWLDIFTVEHDNARTALRWAAAQGDHVLELRLLAALAPFWEIRAHLSEGQRWLEDALARAPDAPLTLRARCLEGAGVLARGQGEFKRATYLIEQAIELYRSLDDPAALAGAIKSLGNVASDRADYATARRLYEESLEIKIQVGDERGIAEAHNNLGVLARLDGDLDASVGYYDKALGFFRAWGDKLAMARVLMNLGEVKMEQDELGAAKGFIRGSLVLCREIGAHWDIADMLEIMASITDGFGRATDAAQLFGAAAGIRDLLGAPLPPGERAAYERRIDRVRRGLPQDRFEAAWAEGRALTLDEAVMRALS